jgi:hypothetical protein
MMGLKLDWAKQRAEIVRYVQVIETFYNQKYQALKARLARLARQQLRKGAGGGGE